MLRHADELRIPRPSRAVARNSTNQSPVTHGHLLLSQEKTLAAQRKEAQIAASHVQQRLAELESGLGPASERLAEAKAVLHHGGGVPGGPGLSANAEARRPPPS